MSPYEPPKPKKAVYRDSHMTNAFFKEKFPGKLPATIEVILKGMHGSKQINFGKSNGLNNKYQATSHNRLIVKDENDKAFFCIKSMRNPELYKIIAPQEVVDIVENNKVVPAAIIDSPSDIPSDEAPNKRRSK